MYNKIIIIGHVGSDPEMRYTPNGKAVAAFSVAANHNYTTSSGEKREETEWFRVSAWERLAESCNAYVMKGMRVYVEGRLKSNQWTGDDGQQRFGNEIMAGEVKFLSRVERQGDAGGGYGGGGYGADADAPAGGGYES